MADRQQVDRRIDVHDVQGLADMAMRFASKVNRAIFFATAGLSIALSCENPTHTPATATTSDETTPVTRCESDTVCAEQQSDAICLAGRCVVVDHHGPALQSMDEGPPMPELVRLSDGDPEPDRFEASLVARVIDISYLPVHKVSGYGYVDPKSGRGGVPGPLIDVEVGTQVLVHFTNELPEETSIHWHGLRLPPEMDGVPHEPIPALAPGASYTYRFVALDPGLYWYHPHVRTDEQAERGLYGIIVVRGPNEPVVDVERILVLDDILLTPQGTLAPPDSMHATFATPNAMPTLSFAPLMGRHGNWLLVNGVVRPSLQVHAGAVERWRVVNVANARYFNLAVPGHELMWIGSDGAFLAAPERRDTMLLANGERVDLLVTPHGHDGERVTVQNRHYDRGHALLDPGDAMLFDMHIGAAPASSSRTHDEWPATKPRVLADGQPEVTLVFGERLSDDGRVEFSFNSAPWPDGPHLQAQAAKPTIWLLQNRTHMDHPFHLHGHFFQPKAVQAFGQAWQPYPQIVWKDTVNVPAWTSMRIAMDFSGFSGHWMFHCHILEHAENDMMGMVEVRDDERLCVPATASCAGSMLRTCSNDGQSWRSTRACERGCTATIDGDAQCEPACLPDTTRCIGRDLQRCDRGDRWVWKQLCPARCVENVRDGAGCVAF